MAATVRDITDSLKGSISRELLTREGHRLAKVGPKPEDNAGVHGGALSHGDLNETEKAQVEAGGHIADLDDAASENPTVGGVSRDEERDKR
jgi:hypothetical protein